MARTRAVPTVRSRRLAIYLREARLAAGLTYAAAAEAADLDDATVRRTEKPAECRPLRNNVKALLGAYGVTDPAEVRRIIALAAQVREPGWWNGYELSESHAAFVALESEASAKCVWENTYIPGLLQTEDYARAVISAGPEQLTPGRLEELVQVRLKRAKLLYREDPVSLHAIVDEAVLARGAWDRKMMAAQLAHLAEMAARPSVLFQVLPFSSGIHPGMSGAFTILKYPDPADPDVVYAETAAGGIYEEDEARIARISKAFLHLSAMALGQRESVALISRYAAGL